MSWIVSKKISENGLVKMTFNAPDIAMVCKQGMYMQIRCHDGDKPMNLPISSWDAEKGIVSVFLAPYNKSDQTLCSKKSGDEVFSISGPYGAAYTIKPYKSVLMVVEDMAHEYFYSIASAFKKEGSRLLMLDVAPVNSNSLMANEYAKIVESFSALHSHNQDERAVLFEELNALVANSKPEIILVTGTAELVSKVFAYAKARSIKVEGIMFSVQGSNSNLPSVYHVNICPDSNLICVEGDDYNAFYENLDKMVVRHSSGNMGFYTKGISLGSSLTVASLAN